MTFWSSIVHIIIKIDMKNDSWILYLNYIMHISFFTSRSYSRLADKIWVDFKFSNYRSKYSDFYLINISALLLAIVLLMHFSWLLSSILRAQFFLTMQNIDRSFVLIKIYPLPHDKSFILHCFSFTVWRD